MAIKRALFESPTADQLQQQLVDLQPDLDRYWSGFAQPASQSGSDNPGRTLADAYINLYLTLPYVVDLKRELFADRLAASPGDQCFEPGRQLKPATPETLFAYESRLKQQIYATLGLTLERDLGTIKRFDISTLAAIPDLLRLLADSDTVSLQKINRSLTPGQSSGLAINTIRDLLRVLCQAEILHEIRPLGSGFGRTTRPAKYLFAAPALRSAVLPLSLIRQPGPASVYDSQKQQFLRGRMLEDAAGMYLRRLFVDQPLPGQLEYDAKAGGADFLVSRVNRRREIITIEVGWQKTSHRQVAQTRRRLRASPYGLVITAGVKTPQLIPEDNVVYVPLPVFLLL